MLLPGTHANDWKTHMPAGEGVLARVELVVLDVVSEVVVEGDVVASVLCTARLLVVEAVVAAEDEVLPSIGGALAEVEIDVDWPAEVEAGVDDVLVSSVEDEDDVVELPAAVEALAARLVDEPEVLDSTRTDAVEAAEIKVVEVKVLVEDDVYKVAAPVVARLALEVLVESLLAEIVVDEDLAVVDNVDENVENRLADVVVRLGWLDVVLARVVEVVARAFVVLILEVVVEVVGVGDGQALS
ncbi:hypothetical protein TI39_contig4367g00001 [Zymoseptoria brevis]|uniref:Uncharacterized protein n=1 Tax=Zymoseptoria brevis TaxID=1047168 RepID=A0A0F4GAG4_9PEZI|nr:hypothetical protein TI39_contig4367g00001 [Zymoseptoria brevis]